MLAHCDECGKAFCFRSLVRSFEIDLIQFLRDRQEGRRWECPCCAQTCPCSLCNFSEPYQPNGKYSIYHVAAIPPNMKGGFIDVHSPLGPKKSASEVDSNSPTSERKRPRPEETNRYATFHEILDPVQRRLPLRKAKAKRTSYKLPSVYPEESDSELQGLGDAEEDCVYPDISDDYNLLTEQAFQKDEPGARSPRRNLISFNQEADSSLRSQDIHNGDNGYICYSDESDDDNASWESQSGEEPQNEKETSYSSPSSQRHRNPHRVESENCLLSSLASSATPQNNQSGRRQSTHPEKMSARSSRSVSRQAPVALYTPPQEPQPENAEMRPISTSAYSTKKMQLQSLREIAEGTRWHVDFSPVYQKITEKITKRQAEITKLETEYETYLKGLREIGETELEADLRDHGRQAGYSC